MKCVLSLLAVLTAPVLFGATVYVSPTGSSTAAGSFNDPYDLATGLSKAVNNQDEIRFLPGTYPLTAQINLVGGVRYLGWNADEERPAEPREVVIDGQCVCKGFVGANLVSWNTIANLTVSNTTDYAIYGQNAGGTVISNCVLTCTKKKAIEIGGYNGTGVDIVDCDFTRCEGTGTAIVGTFGEKVNLTRCRFLENRQTTGTSAYGSLVAGGTTYTDCVISNNTGVGHGLFYNSESRFYDCVFGGNVNDSDGGVASVADRSHMHFYGCRFLNNTAKSGGCFSSGFISGNSVGGAFNVSNCTFVGNVATNGGVQYWQTTSNGTHPGCTNRYFDCRFVGNAAKSGGVLYVTGWKAESRSCVTHCVFEGNHVTGAGGAIANAYITKGTIVCNDCTFEGNVAGTGGALSTLGGGGAAEQRNFWAVTNCTFRGNRATNGGAGYHLAGSISGCLFSDNIASNAAQTAVAAGIVLFGGNGYNYDKRGYLPDPLSIDRCVFSNNFTYGKGASVISGMAEYGTSPWKDVYYVSNMSVRVSNCTFVRNRNTSRDNFTNTGGGVISLLSYRDFLIENCAFTENDSYGYGFVIGAAPRGTKESVLANGVIRNCLFLGNRGFGSYGGVTASACYLKDPNTFVESCTFVSNVSMNGSAGALALSSEEPATDRVINTLFYQNKATNGAAQPEIAASETLRANAFLHCFETRGILSGPGCIGMGLDPKFVDWEKGDCRLAHGSPCVNAGTNQLWMAGARDLQNSKKIPRIIGDTVDIGCYEYRATPGFLLLFR